MVAVPASIVLVLPSLKVSGGVKEAVKLARGLAAHGARACLMTMWQSPHPISSPTLEVAPLSHWKTRTWAAPAQLPVLLARFWKQTRLPESVVAGKLPSHYVFTHFSTLPLAFMVERSRRWFFVQDLEWMFYGHGVAARMLQWFILALYRRGRVISANSYLTAELRRLGVAVEAEAPIWADPIFRSQAEVPRDIDAVMVLRKGDHKRLDMYMALIEHARRESPSLTLAVITPETEVGALVRGRVRHCWLRPDVAAMRAVYERSRCFIHLSEHEGFGLPPLEAMGAGCVPLCRDSGGVRAYMVDSLKELLIPRDWPVDRILARLVDVLAVPQAWSTYSPEAQRIFDAGLKHSQSRSDCLLGLLSPASTAGASF